VKWRKLGHEARVARRIGAELVQPQPGTLQVAGKVLQALVGRPRDEVRLDQARDFEVTPATEIVVESRKKRVRVATDGEITMMTPPLRFRIRPASLVVVGADRDRSAAT